MAEEKKGSEAVRSASEKPSTGEKPAGAPAPEAKEKKKEKKGKHVRTGKKHLKIDTYKFYKIEGDKVVVSKKPCPRCGPGTWMADHKGRSYCGRCHYTAFEKKN